MNIVIFQKYQKSREKIIFNDDYSTIVLIYRFLRNLLLFVCMIMTTLQIQICTLLFHLNYLIQVFSPILCSTVQSKLYNLRAWFLVYLSLSFIGHFQLSEMNPLLCCSLLTPQPRAMRTKDGPLTFLPWFVWN